MAVVTMVVVNSLQILTEYQIQIANTVLIQCCHQVGGGKGVRAPDLLLHSREFKAPLRGLWWDPVKQA